MLGPEKIKFPKLRVPQKCLCFFENLEMQAYKSAIISGIMVFKLDSFEKRPVTFKESGSILYQFQSYSNIESTYLFDFKQFPERGMLMLLGGQGSFSVSPSLHTFNAKTDFHTRGNEASNFVNNNDCTVLKKHHGPSLFFLANSKYSML